MIQFLRPLDTWSEVSFPFSSRSQTRRVNSGQTRQEFDLLNPPQRWVLIFEIRPGLEIAMPQQSD